MNNKIENDNEFLIPINIRISNNDLVNNNDNINTVSYSGSIIPKEFSLKDILFLMLFTLVTFLKSTLFFQKKIYMMN